MVRTFLSLLLTLGALPLSAQRIRPIQDAPLAPVSGAVVGGVLPGLSAPRFEYSTPSKATLRMAAPTPAVVSRRTAAALPALTAPADPRPQDSPLAPVAQTLADPAHERGLASLKEEADDDFSRRLGEKTGPLRVLMVGAESVPFVKTGGLADVVDALSRGLAANGHQVSLMVPRYPSIDAEAHGLTPVPGVFEVPVAGRREPVRLWHKRHEGVDVYFIDNKNVYSRDGPYHPLQAGYDDTDERFIFFSHAALEAARRLDIRPDIIHTHDWHTGLIPALVRHRYADDASLSQARTIHTIHNIAYQGRFPFESLLKAGLDAAHFTFDRFEHYGMFNLLKAGLVSADALTTVSKTYAREVQSGPEFGHGLEGLLAFRSADLSGIRNGIDMKLWDPARDENIHQRYSTEDSAAGKAANKRALQSETGLALDPEAPVFGVVSRLDHQKGLDLVADMAPALVRRGVQLVIAGSGDKALEGRFKELAARYPKNVFLHGFSESFGRKIYAASDFLLMPSRFEPCGLSQLIAQRYGSLPLVTPTGGLADTVTDLTRDPASGDGFKLRELSPEGLTEALDRAMALYSDKAALARARRTAMDKDSSWTAPLEEYIALYRRVLAGSRSIPPR